MGDRAEQLAQGEWDVAYELIEDVWQDRSRLQARLLDAHGA